MTQLTGYEHVEDRNSIERRALSTDDFDDGDNMDSSFYDDEPTEEECKRLRRIADQLPWAVWYVHLSML